MARTMGARLTKALTKGRSDAANAPERPDLSAYEIALFCNVLGVAPLQLAKAREAITARYDLGPRGAWIVGLLEVGVNSPSGLTDVLCIGRSLVTAEINRLLQAGLISGNQDASDGRRTVLALTEEGKQVSRELRQRVNDFVTGRLAGYSREAILAATALLQDFAGGAQIGELKE